VVRPGGEIEQWGISSALIVPLASETITLPVAFPNVIWNVIATALVVAKLFICTAFNGVAAI
jgi:hypothetical protein